MFNSEDGTMYGDVDVKVRGLSVDVEVRRFVEFFRHGSADRVRRLRQMPRNRQAREIHSTSGTNSTSTSKPFHSYTRCLACSFDEQLPALM
jgi:hypothetical protein